MDNIVRDYVTPILKDEGFRKRGRTFFKEFEDIIWVLDIQSGWNSPTTANFTINLGVVFPRVWDVINGGPRPENPIKIQWTVNQRIGLLLPRSTDTWWSLKKVTDIDAKGPEVRSIIVDYALPFLKKFTSASDLLTLYMQDSENLGSNNSRVHAAIIANHLGDIHYARKLLLEQMDATPNTHKVVEISVRIDGARTSKEKEYSNKEQVDFIRQCAKRMAMDI